jgi:predicted membrane protein
MVMFAIAIFSLVGTLFTALPSRKYRCFGFIGSGLSCVAWIIYGLLTSQYVIVFQFAGYMIVNSIGVYSNYKEPNHG